MTILNTCCCWVPLRKGCFVCGIYTLVTYTFMIAIGTLQVDTSVSSANDTNIMNSISHYNEAPFPITVTVMTCSGLTVVASIILMVGLYLENRLLLLPWIMIVFITTFVDFVCTVYMLGTDSMHPAFAVVVTADFCISFSNIYCLLCVISLYQEYKDGRTWGGGYYFENPSQNGGGGRGVHAAPNSKRSVTFIENDHVSKVHLPPPPIRARRSSNPVSGAFAKLNNSFKNHDHYTSSGAANDVISGDGVGSAAPTLARHLAANSRVSLSSGNVNELLYRENNLGLELGLWTESKCCNGTVVASVPDRDRRRSSARHVQFQPTIEEAESSSDGVQVTQLKDVLNDENVCAVTSLSAASSKDTTPTPPLEEL